MKKIVVFCLFIFFVSTYLYSYEVSGEVISVFKDKDFIFLDPENRSDFPVNPKIFFNNSTKFYAVRNNNAPEMVKVVDLLPGDYIKCISKTKPAYFRGSMPEIYADTVICYESILSGTISKVTDKYFVCSSASYKFYDETNDPIVIKIINKNSVRNGLKSEIKKGDVCYFTVNPVKNTVNCIFVVKRNNSVNDPGKYPDKDPSNDPDKDSDKDIRQVSEKEECARCSGDGKFPCYSCDQNGYYFEEELDWDAKGNAKIKKRRVKCSDCNGHGYIKCDDCGGKGYNIVRF